MNQAIFDIVRQKYQRKNPIDFQIGDDVVVTLKIVEGGKERLQDFEGTVIARRGSGLNEMFTVRRLVGNEGVERTFPIHSPRIVAIKTKRSGKVRRCKLYFLRHRVGKARKLKERRISAAARAAAQAARSAKARQAAEAEQIAAAAQQAESGEPVATS